MSSFDNEEKYPFVSICTPTFNRRPFIKTMFACYINQTYPKDRMEWIIVDDGTDKIKDLVIESNLPEIRYFEIENKMMLGAKRNYMHKHCRGSIIVYMDDDDYYPPDRVAHAVERLQSNPSALCAGSSEIYIYFKHLPKMIQCGPYGPNHATAGTFAFRKKLLDDTRYDDSAAIAEEKAFLKDYTIPFVQLDPVKTILVFSHEHNTYDKRKMFDNPHPQYFKESTKTVETFIKEDYESNIKQFFLTDIDNLLKDYEPGLSKMKPDVLIQIKEIEDRRNKLLQEMQEKENRKPVVVQEPGKPPRELTTPQVIEIIKNQQNLITKLNKDVYNMQNQLGSMQSNYIKKSIQLDILKKENDDLKKQIMLYTNAEISEKKTKLLPDNAVDISKI